MWNKQHERHTAMNTPFSISLLRKLYARMLLTRLVDERLVRLHTHGYGDVVASCLGHEAAQVATAICIEIGQDFTLPYYRDLGVILTIGMTPYEIFRTYLQSPVAQIAQDQVTDEQKRLPARHMPMPDWSYQKRNAVMGPVPVATHILHAAGIAFASKLRKAPVVTVAYCGDGATCEPDFYEGIRFAAQHQLPAVFICEQDCSAAGQNLTQAPSCLRKLELPTGLTHQRLDGTDTETVYNAMQQAMHHAREGHGPVLLEMDVVRSTEITESFRDPLLRCQQWLERQEAWDPQWADALYNQITEEVEQAMHNAIQDMLPVALLPESQMTATTAFVSSSVVPDLD